jgi:hypothetical protein
MKIVNLFTTKGKIEKQILFISIVLAIFILVRVFFHTGLINCQSQDDGLYLAYSRALIRGNLDFPTGLVNEKYVNPVWVPKLRLGMLFPTAIFIKIIGLRDFGSAFFPFISSILLFFVTLAFCRLLFKKNTEMQIISILLLTFFPLNVIYSTRIMPDVPSTLFATLGVLLFLIGEKKRKNYFFVLSGISIGIGYLIKELAVIFFLFFPLYYIFLDQRKNIKSNIVKLTYIFVGFLFVYFFETAYFYKETSAFFYRTILLKKVHLQKMEVEYGLTSPSYNLGVLNFFFPSGYDFLYHLKNMLTSPLNIEFAPYGWYFFFVFISIFYAFAYRKKEVYFLVLWFFLLYFYLEFGPTDIFIQNVNGHYVLNYFFIFKEGDASKQANILTIPLILLIAYFLSNVSFGFRIVLLIFLIFTSLITIEKNYSFLRDGINDTREAAMFLKSLPAKTVYTDYLASGQIEYFMGGNYSGSFVNMYGLSLEDIKNGYVIVGGSRGCDILGSTVMEMVPNFAKNPPNDWKLLKVIEGKITWYREANMRIYEVQ